MKVVHRAVVLIGIDREQRTDTSREWLLDWQCLWWLTVFLYLSILSMVLDENWDPLSWPEVITSIICGQELKSSSPHSQKRKKILAWRSFTRNTIICSISCCKKISIVPLRWCSVEEFRGTFLFRTSLTANIQGRDNTTTTPTLWKNMTMPWIQTYIHKTLTHKKQA